MSYWPYVDPLPITGSVTVQEPLSVDDNGNSLTVDGTVSVGNFPSVQPVSDNGGSLTVDGEVDIGNLPTDAFGRVQVSDPDNRFDVEFIYDKQPLLMDETITGGACAQQGAGRDVLMTHDATVSDETMLASHYYIPYTPGCSQLIEMTGTLDDTDIGTGTAYFFLRDSRNGLQETEYAQAAWNINTMSGIDWAFSHILSMRFQSLKVGRIEFGFVQDGVYVPAHYINNDNVRDRGYWQQATLPVYWKVYRPTGESQSWAEMGYGDDDNAIGIRYKLPTTDATLRLRAICATVKSEGGGTIQDMPGYKFSAFSGTTAKTSSTPGTYVPLLSIRPATTFNTYTNKALAIPTGFNVLTNNNVHWRIKYRPSLTSASFAAVDSTYSIMEVDTAATATTGGIVIASGLAAGAFQSSTTVNGLLERIIMAVTQAGTQDILTLEVTELGTNASVFGTLSWKEIR